MDVPDHVDDDLHNDRSLSVVSYESASSDSWSAPSAREVKEERQREWRAEADLMALRQEMASMESEVAVEATHETGATAAAADAKISKPYEEALALLTALSPYPKNEENKFVQALKNRGPRNVLQGIIDEMVDVVTKASDPYLWPAEERMTIVRILCAAVVWGGGLRARRTLHWILEGCRPNELRELARGGGGVRLADGVRSGGYGGETLAALIVANELSALARAPTPYPLTAENVASLLARCQGQSHNRHQQLLVKALAGRALPLIDSHAQLPPQAFQSRGHNVADDRLAIATSRLQILFGSKSNISNLSQL